MGSDLAAFDATTCTGAAADGHPHGVRDRKDAAAVARPGARAVVIPSSSGFDWTDAVIGAAGGLGLAVTLAAGLALARPRRSVASAS